HLDMDLTRAQMERLCADLLERMVPPTRQALADAKLSGGNLGRPLLGGGAPRMPARHGLGRRTFRREPYRGLNPDEGGALGAALRGGVLNEEVSGVLLRDVTPLSVGIETVGGGMARIIERNTTIPTQGTRVFTTARDGQTSVEIKVYQGE